MTEFRIETDRLLLREWRREDAHAMHVIGQDMRVMAFLGPIMTHEDAEALVAGQIVNQSLFGHCFWPIERRSDGAVLGFCGLNPGSEGTPIFDTTEIGWRLAYDAWGQGYAREAAVGCLEWAFSQRAIDQVAAMTVPQNLRSRVLMQRLGMRHDPSEDFDHPALSADDPLRRHVVYRVERPDR